MRIMDLSLLPSFAHYSLAPNGSTSYGHSLTAGNVEDYGGAYVGSTASSSVATFVTYPSHRPPTLSPYAEPYLMPTSVMKESDVISSDTTATINEFYPYEHGAYYYLENKLYNAEWSGTPENVPTVGDTKLTTLTTVPSSAAHTPPLTPRTPECKAFYVAATSSTSSSASLLTSTSIKHPGDDEQATFIEKSPNRAIAMPGAATTTTTTATATMTARQIKMADSENYITITNTATGVVRVVKRRSANKKERRRTQSINSAFSNLRDCIPNVPADTKLSKIKTLRLATSYISYLMELLEGPRENSYKLLSEGFRADLSNSKRSSQQNRLETQNEIQRHLRMQLDKQSMRRQMGTNDNHQRAKKSCDRSMHKSSRSCEQTHPNNEAVDTSRSMCTEANTLCRTSNAFQSTCGFSLANNNANGHNTGKSKCRTGWPQHVWALELKHYEQ